MSVLKTCHSAFLLVFLILFPSVTNAFPIGRVGSSIVLSCCPDTVRRNLHPDQAPDLEAHGHELIKRYLQQQKDAAAAASSTSSLLLVNPKQPVRTTRAGGWLRRFWSSTGGTTGGCSTANTKDAFNSGQDGTSLRP